MGTSAKEWEERCKRATTTAQIATLYMELEAALKWGMRLLLIFIVLRTYFIFRALTCFYNYFYHCAAFL